MPSSATVGSTHPIAAVSAVGYPDSWNHASNRTMTAVAPPNPSSIGAASVGSTSVNLARAGASPEFRVLRKNGASQTFSGAPAGAAALVYVGIDATAPPAASLRRPHIPCDARQGIWGEHVFDRQSDGECHDFVRCGGNALLRQCLYRSDTANGLSDGTAFKTINKGLTVALTGGTINFAAGTYNQGVVKRFR